eukprot:215370_1
MINKFSWPTHRCLNRLVPTCTPVFPYTSHFQKRHHIHLPVRDKNVAERNRELAKRCEDVTKTGVYANIGLVILKSGAGYMTNSMALIADATHSLTDLMSDFMTYFTIKYSQREPTKRFPLGFGKVDTLGTLPVATLLTFGSYHIVTTSINKLYLLYSGAAAGIIIMPYVAMSCVI